METSIITAEKANVTTNEQTLNSFFVRFGAFIDGSRRTRQTYLDGVKRFLEYLAKRGVKSPNRGDIIAYRDYLSLTLRASTVNTYLVAVRQFFAFLESENAYKNIADHVKGIKTTRDFKKDSLDAAQARDILQQPNRNTPTGARDYALLMLLLTGALRTIEIERANIGDLDGLNSQARLYIQGKGKADKGDFINLPEITFSAIRDYLETLPEERREPTAPLFQSFSNRDKGERLSTRTIRGIVKHYLRLAGYNSPRLTAHSLRHTAVTLALLGGQTLQEAQQFARHTNISTTTIYAHNLDKSQNRCSQTVATAIFNK